MAGAKTQATVQCHRHIYFHKGNKEITRLADMVLSVCLIIKHMCAKQKTAHLINCYGQEEHNLLCSEVSD